MKETTNKRNWFLIIRSTHDGLYEHTLIPGRNTFGRRSDNTIVLHDNSASGRHAEIYYNQSSDTATIRDLNSTNGTFVNGKRIHEPQVLKHNDQVRVGLCLITIVNSKSQAFEDPPTTQSKTQVTGQLILESLDQYGVLLHEVGRRLVNMPDLDTALSEIADVIKLMVGAKECRIILADKFGNLEELSIPVSIARKTIEDKTATLFSGIRGENPGRNTEKTIPVHSVLPMLMVPVLIDEKVVGLIFARKAVESTTPFYNSDLQFVLAISNQVAMSILRSRVEGELIYNSYHDTLTELPNRALFLERLVQSISRAKHEDGFVFAVLFFDIDNFKIINDSLGHGVGDKLLIAMANRLKQNVRSVDMVARHSVIARFGGDEFAILLDDIHESDYAVAGANRLIRLLAAPFHIAGKDIYVTVSIGVSVSLINYLHPEDILQDADIAMYHAKASGKGQVAVYDKVMRDRVSRRMHMGTAIRQGAIQKEFRLHYQPIVSLQRERIVGFEALLRWYTPDKGILNPDDFMGVINTAGLIYATDHWVLKTACHQIAEWQKKFPSNPPLYISVNLSPKNIKHPNLIETVHEVLQETKISPNSLFLEITEKVSTPDDESAIDVLKKLRSLGVRISLDDFGTGYSALNYLARFPVDALKIDQSFIKTIGEENSSEKIIEMIRTLGSHLGLTIIAEGVEKAEQVPFLRSIHCEYVQGFFYAKPLESRVVTELLAKQHSR